MKWVDAIREYSKKMGVKYSIPKKGSPAYDEIKKMMDAANAPPQAPSHGATKVPVHHSAPKKAEKPLRKVRAKKADEAVSADPATAALTKERKPRKPRAKKTTTDLLGATGADVASSKNPEVLLNNAVNMHEPVAPPAALAGDLSALKEAVAKVRKPRALPKLVEPEKVENEAPFSVQALRRKLGA